MSAATTSSRATAGGASGRPFEITVPEEALVELRRADRGGAVALQGAGRDRSQGVQLATIRELARYWMTEYGWRRFEARLNAPPPFKTEINGVDIHFIHVKSPHEETLPLILTHGWPGSIVEMLAAIGPLTDPTANGGCAEDAFDLVVPSIQATASRLSRPSWAGPPAASARRGGS